MKNEPSEIGGGKDLQFLRPQMVTSPTTGQSCIAGIFFTRFNKLEKTHLCTSWNMCSLESLWLLIVYSTLRPIWNTLTRTPSLLWSSSYRQININKSIYINFKYAIDTAELHWRSHSIPIHLLTAEVTGKTEVRSRESHSNPSQYLLNKFRIKLTPKDKPNQPARPASTYLRDLESSLPQTTNVNLYLVINFSRSYTFYYVYAKISSFMSPS